MDPQKWFYNLCGKLIVSIANRTKFILQNPGACQLASFSDTRVAAIGHFSIYYKTTDTNIIITAFWDNRQDPKKLLELLKYPN